MPINTENQIKEYYSSLYSLLKFFLAKKIFLQGLKERQCNQEWATTVDPSSWSQTSHKEFNWALQKLNSLDLFQKSGPLTSRPSLQEYIKSFEQLLKLAEGFLQQKDLTGLLKSLGKKIKENKTKISPKCQKRAQGIVKPEITHLKQEANGIEHEIRNAFDIKLKKFDRIFSQILIIFFRELFTQGEFTPRIPRRKSLLSPPKRRSAHDFRDFLGQSLYARGKHAQSKNWKTPTTSHHFKNATSPDNQKHPSFPTEYSLHHMLPKEFLQRLYDAAKRDYDQNPANLDVQIFFKTLMGFSPYYGISDTVNLNDIIINFYPNLLLGPLSDMRIDDPGSEGFDSAFSSWSKSPSKNEKLDQKIDFILFQIYVLFPEKNHPNIAGHFWRHISQLLLEAHNNWLRKFLDPNKKAIEAFNPNKWLCTMFAGHPLWQRQTFPAPLNAGNQQPEQVAQQVLKNHIYAELGLNTLPASASASASENKENVPQSQNSQNSQTTTELLFTRTQRNTDLNGSPTKKPRTAPNSPEKRSSPHKAEQGSPTKKSRSSESPEEKKSQKKTARVLFS